MDTLTYEELLDLQDEIMGRLPETITSRLLMLNTNGRLEDLLKLLGMEDLVEGADSLDSWPEGKIVVFGDPRANVNDLCGVAGSLGIHRNRVVFVPFERCERYDYRSLEYNHEVVAVMFGASPHSTSGKGSYSSVITRMESQRDVFPRVIRLSANSELKITKRNFREALEGLISAGLLLPEL